MIKQQSGPLEKIRIGIEDLFFQFKRLLLWMFPIQCLGCGKVDETICPGCLEKLEIVDNENSFRLHGGSPLNGLFYCYDYDQNNIVTKALWKLKFRSMADFSVPLAVILEKKLKLIKQSRLLNEDYCCVVVPAKISRIKRTGFNQVELIVDQIGELFHKKINILISKETAIEQKQLNLEERKLNIHNKFDVTKKLNGETILAIDDVATTLATLDEIAGTLKRAGAGKVFGLVLLRQKKRVSC